MKMNKGELTLEKLAAMSAEEITEYLKGTDNPTGKVIEVITAYAKGYNPAMTKEATKNVIDSMITSGNPLAAYDTLASVAFSMPYGDKKGISVYMYLVEHLVDGIYESLNKACISSSKLHRSYINDAMLVAKKLMLQFVIPSETRQKLIEIGGLRIHGRNCKHIY